LTPTAPPLRCPRCLLQRQVCLCDEIPRVDTRTRIVILRHVQETHKASNSGRLAALALSNCALLDYGRRGAPLDADRAGELREPGTWLLFPIGAPTRAAPRPPPRRLVVLDATWAQARRMYQRIDALRGLPVLALPAPERAPDQLRTPPRADGVATIQAIARAVALLEGDAAAAPLDRIYELMVERSRLTARHR